jgi:tRNA-Thr(GGU) m(6)t(6)A37 methyltransferase TsaA
MATSDCVIHPIGVVESPIKHPRDAPRQGDESTVESWIRIHPDVRRAARELRARDKIIVLTWLHAASRDVLAIHPRADLTRPLTGVFSTRSEHRLNPIGLHEVEIVRTRPERILVRGLEAIDGTPVVDIKPVLEPKGSR